MKVINLLEKRIGQRYADLLLGKEYHKEKTVYLESLRSRLENCEYNGDRITVEFKKTKYECSDSNLTIDYRYCR